MFTCSACGECCQHVGDVKEIESVDGVCINYNPSTKLCKIYDNRPLICRVDEGHSKFFANMEIEEYYKANYEVCAKFRKDLDNAK